MHLKRAQNTAPERRKSSGQNRGCKKRLSHFQTLGFKESNSLLHRLLKLLLFEVLRHINFEQINGISDLPGKEHGVDGGQNHPGNGDDGPFLAPAPGTTLIFQSVVRVLLVFHGCVGDLYQRRFEINSCM